MKYIADLHTHSHFSRATSKNANLDGYYQWAIIKGINLIGTGDFTHPGWLNELKERLKDDGTGFYSLKDPPTKPPDEIPITDLMCKGTDIRFCLTAEISSIYKKGDKTRKVHSVIFSPDLEVASKISDKLSTIGNIKSDGRPILGLDVKHLLEIILDISDEAYLIPAHIWTPWFSLFGSKSGFDVIEECFEDLTEHIFAIETGLSSDPEMNWRCSALDKYTLISNSDAHSPRKLGREANIFDTGFNYNDMFTSLKTKKGYLGTIEFYPEEGKYHLDGHRKCGVCLEPEKTKELNGLCPECGKPLTVGVMHRVLDLSDRKKGIKPEGSADYKYLIPLPEIISEIMNLGSGTKGVLKTYADILKMAGSEFSFLLDMPEDEIQKLSGSVFSEAIRRMRTGKIYPKPGYDGEFGTIKVFKQDELSKLLGQENLFSFEINQKRRIRSSERKGKGRKIKKKEKINQEKEDFKLNSLQEQVLTVTEGCVLVTAGPGTGKTRTLTSWIANILKNKIANPEEILAITFTNKTQKEMAERLFLILGNEGRKINVFTFHSFCFELVRERFPKIKAIYDESRRRDLLTLLFPELSDNKLISISKELEAILENPQSTANEQIVAYGRLYLDKLKKLGAVDLSSLISGINQIFRKDESFLEYVRGKYRFMAIDELQDINLSQYRFIQNLFPPSHPQLKKNKRGLLAIGDPDQAIYGFRGSDLSLFYRFRDEYNPKEIQLRLNYRSKETIIKASEAVVSHNSVSRNNILLSNRKSGEKIIVFRASNPKAEANYISSKIEQLVGGMNFNTADSSLAYSKLYSFSDICVLTRTKAIRDNLVPFLNAAGIPVSIGSSSPFMSEPPFCFIYSILNLLLNRDDVVAWSCVLNNLLSSFSPHLAKSILHLAKSILPFTGKENDYVFHSTLQNDEVKKFLVFLDTLSVILKEEGICKVLELITEEYVMFDEMEKDIIIKKESLFEMATEYGSDIIAFLRKTALSPFESEGPFKTDKVRLFTFHASKGLEFPVVFIAGAEEGITPITGSKTNIEEERRLFYVAMTRAKDNLIISSSSERKFYGNWMDNETSRFISEIPLNLKEEVKNTKEKEMFEQLQLFNTRGKIAKIK